MKKVNYAIGALKRKFKTGPTDQEPGTFISKANAQKAPQQEMPKGKPAKVAIMGAI